MNEEYSWESNAVRVGKYNPKYRDINGSYIRDEWMAYNEVGQRFNGCEFSLEEYYSMEERYIFAAKLYFQMEGCKSFIVKGYENYINEGMFLYRDKDLIPLYKNMSEGKEYDISYLDDIIRLVLRNYIWCGLISKEDFRVSVRFSGDFYMFFVNDLDLRITPLKQLIEKKTGLFMT